MFDLKRHNRGARPNGVRLGYIFLILHLSEVDAFFLDDEGAAHNLGVDGGDILTDKARKGQLNTTEDIKSDNDGPPSRPSPKP